MTDTLQASALLQPFVIHSCHVSLFFVDT